MEEVISVTEYLASVVRRGKKVIVLMLACAVLLGGWKAYRAASAGGRGGESAAQEAQYQQALAQYQRSRDAIEAQMALIQGEMEAGEAALADSLLLKLDPYHVFAAHRVLTVTNPDGSALLLSGSDAAEEYLAANMVRQYVGLWEVCDISAELSNTGYDGVADQYVRELVRLDGQDGVLTVTALGGSDEAAGRLADAVCDYLGSRADTVAAGTVPHRLHEVDRGTRETADRALAKEQKDALSAISAGQTSLDTLKKQMNNLKAPVQQDDTPSLRSVVKYAVLGAVVGLAAACVLIWIMGVLKKTVESSYQVERIFTVPFLGAPGQRKGGFGRLADRITGERIWADQTQAVDYAAEKIRTHLAGKNGVVLACAEESLRDRSAVDAVVEKLADAGVSARLICGFGKNAEAVRALNDCGGVVLVEQRYRSRLTDTAEIVAGARAAESPVLGFLLV